MAVYSYLSDNVSAFSALAGAVAAVVSLLLSLRNIKRRMRDECDRRVAELRLAFEDGLRYELRKDEP